MDVNRFDWLSQRVEGAIDPKRRIVDPHHHLYAAGPTTYLAIDHIADATATHNVTATVFVECATSYDLTQKPHLQPLGETRFAAAEADAIDAAGGPPLTGIVAFVDLTLGDALEEVIATHREASNGRLCGIRHTTGWDPSNEIIQGHGNPFDGIMDTDEFRSGLRTVAEMGLTFDSWLFHPQLPELAAMAAAIPHLTVVVGHLGAPLGVGPYHDRQEQVRLDWRASMTALAALPNVVVKLGGFGLDALFGTGWSHLPVPPGSEEVASYWSDVVRFCIDTFGPDRCMFESNYPIDRETLTYPVIWNACQIMAANYADTEQEELFSGTAIKTFRLSP